MRYFKKYEEYQYEKDLNIINEVFDDFLDEYNAVFKLEINKELIKTLDSSIRYKRTNQFDIHNTSIVYGYTYENSFDWYDKEGWVINKYTVNKYPGNILENKYHNVQLEMNGEYIIENWTKIENSLRNSIKKIIKMTDFRIHENSCVYFSNGIYYDPSQTDTGLLKMDWEKDNSNKIFPKSIENPQIMIYFKHP